MLFFKNQIINYLFIFVIVYLTNSCGKLNQSAQHDDTTGDINQVIMFSQGWGRSYNYPVTLDISTQISIWTKKKNK